MTYHIKVNGEPFCASPVQLPPGCGWATCEHADQVRAFEARDLIEQCAEPGARVAVYEGHCPRPNEEGRGDKYE